MGKSAKCLPKRGGRYSLGCARAAGIWQNTRASPVHVSPALYQAKCVRGKRKESCLVHINRGMQGAWRGVVSTAMTHFWFKSFFMTSSISVFFWAYLYLLKNPAWPVATMPVTAIDRFVGAEPLALPFYLSLWIYVSLPPILMPARRDILEYGAWMGSLCLFALGIFYFWPSAVPPSNIDWAMYPGMAFLKNLDGAGNACPSLHVATAVFSAFWLHGRLPALGLGHAPRLFSATWCVAIVYSTMATKQHLAVDVLAGSVLGAAFAMGFRNRLRFGGRSRAPGRLQRSGP